MGTEEHFIKEKGIEKLIYNLGDQSNFKTYLCCDNRNDISLVEYVSNKFLEYCIICPSNVNGELRDHLKRGDFNYKIVEQDCSKLSEGLKKLISNYNY